MKKFNLILFILIIIIFSGLFISCDFLFPSPLGRNNPFDNEAQIGRFNVAVSGSDSLVTNWDWHDALSSIDDKRIIDRIRIVHSSGNRPTGIGLLFDDNVQEFKSTATWSYKWLGLQTDRDHYFALYAHEKGGLWLSPKYINTYLDPSVQDNNISLLAISPPSNSTEFVVYEVLNPSFTPSDVTTATNYPWSAGDFLVLEFNINETIFFDQFLLYLKNSTPGSDVDLTIYVIKKDLQHITDWADMVSANTIDYNSSLSRQVTTVGGTDQAIEISEIANRMSLYYSHSIAITINNPLTVDISTWTIDTHFWGNNQ